MLLKDPANNRVQGLIPIYLQYYRPELRQRTTRDTMLTGTYLAQHHYLHINLPLQEKYDLKQQPSCKLLDFHTA